MAEDNMVRVHPLGRTVHIDDDRVVFVGTHEDYPDDYFIGLRNAKCEVTRFILSKDSFDALVWLHGQHDQGLRETFPTEKRELAVWRIRKTVQALMGDALEEE